MSKPFWTIVALATFITGMAYITFDPEAGFVAVVASAIALVIIAWIDLGRA